MKIFLNENVWQVGLERMEYLFDEFKNIVVSFSGGKDSTVTLELALQVARKRNRLPLTVYFLDQEAEWSAVIDYVKEVMYRKEINPLWIQVPMFLPNSISQEEPYLLTWEEGKEWMREKDPIAIKEGHVLSQDTSKEPKAGYWYEYFVKSMNQLFPEEPACFLAGMRAEESPQRLAGLTSGQCYKHITWGRILDKKKNQYTFYPLFDWKTSDIWKAIHENKWKYCKIYDEFFRYGLPIRDMRVSNLTHESALKSLFYLHELEGDTWEKLNKRLKGINQAKHIEKKDLLQTKKLPFMFRSWKEYRNYLTEKLITEKKHQDIFFKAWKKMDEFYDDMKFPSDLHQKQIRSILVNDLELVKLNNYLQTPSIIVYREWKKGNLLNRARSPNHLNQIKDHYLSDDYRNRMKKIFGSKA
jgi:predicted phosphoadenosine phosphosulfate sulfurtransferase